MPPLSQKWCGPVCCATGVVMLVVQVVAYLDVGLLSSWLMGGGIGLILGGAAAWFYYLDDKRSAPHLADEEEFDGTFEKIHTGSEVGAPIEDADDHR